MEPSHKIPFTPAKTRKHHSGSHLALDNFYCIPSYIGYSLPKTFYKKRKEKKSSIKPPIRFLDCNSEYINLGEYFVDHSEAYFWKIYNQYVYDAQVYISIPGDLSYAVAILSWCLETIGAWI